MNQRQHREEAERLAAVVRNALDNLDIVTSTEAVDIVKANIKLAQVHATLATVPDKVDHRGMGYA